MRKLLVFVVMVFIASSVSAQVILPNPIPVTIRDSNTENQYSAQLVGYVDHFSATETDSGINPFEEGTNTVTLAGAAQLLPYTDFNIADSAGINTDIVEFISDNFDVLTPWGWVSGNGYSIAVIMSANSAGLAGENGLGNVALGSIGGPNIYGSYTNRYNNNLGNGRLYVPSMIAIEFSFANPTGAYSVYPRYMSPDLKDDILAFGTTYPMASTGVLTQPYSTVIGACPTITVPSNILTYGGNCYYQNQYISYLDISTINLGNEGNLLPMPGSTASFGSAVTGIYENNPSVSINPNGPSGEYLIARETNLLNPSFSNFDIAVYNILTNMDQGTIPEINPILPANQLYPSFDYPFISFLEIPSGMYPCFNSACYPISADLHLWNMETNTRTTILLANNVGFAELAYDSNAGSGILVFINNIGSTLWYYLLDSNGVVGNPVEVPIDNMVSIANNEVLTKVTSSNNNHYIYYGVSYFDTLTQSMGSRVIQHYVNSGINNIVFEDPNIRLSPNSFQTLQIGDEGLSVTGDNNLLSINTLNFQNGLRIQFIANIDQNKCTNPPCYIYEKGDFIRSNYVSSISQVPNNNHILVLDEDYTDQEIIPFIGYNTPIGIIDISNL